ncbi:MAG: hypothetical protein HQ530_01360 [Parcubacteria group bacterium]|nr:hypothetical protein [Parcubacteria group bacterium]
MAQTYHGIRDAFNSNDNEYDFTSEISQSKALADINEATKGGRRRLKNIDLRKILKKRMGSKTGTKAFNKLTGGKGKGGLFW